MLGKLQQVDLREIWKHEAINFTNWLANEDKLNLLGEELGGIQIELTRASSLPLTWISWLRKWAQTGRSLSRINWRPPITTTWVRSLPMPQVLMRMIS